MHPAKLMIAAGVIVVGLGLIWLALSRMGVEPGRLPGDLAYRGERVSVSFPIMTCLLLSALLTVLTWWLSRGRGP